MRDIAIVIFLIIGLNISVGSFSAIALDGSNSIETSSSSRSSVITVAKDGTGDHNTIQDAVDASSDGDTIRVYDGVYKEAVWIDNSITLIGNGTGRTILDGDGTLDHQHLFRINSIGINVTGFQFREGSPHHEFAGIGIYSSKVRIFGNLFYDNNIGIYLAGGPDIEISNNSFDLNYYGIRSDAGSDGNFILDNYFNSSTSAGILYLGARYVTILRNEFNDNAYHLGLFNSYDYDIGHNLFYNADPGRSGVMMGTSMNNNIHNNTFRENDVGIGLSTGADQNHIYNNIFENNNEGIRSYQTINNVRVHYNSFINNSVWGINCSSSSSNINATYNWWGNHTGPYDPISNPAGTGDNVTVNVTYVPWLLGKWINQPPQLDEVGDQFAREDTKFLLDFNASDPDGHEIFFKVETNASWLEVNFSALEFSGIPSNIDVGRFFIYVNVTDGMGGYDEENVTLIVNNTPPEIFTSSLPNAVEDLQYHFEIDHDNEEGALWNCITNSSWLTFNSTEQSLSGIPSNEDVGSYWVLLNVSDENGGYDEVNLTIVVFGVDDPPFIQEALENIEMYEDSTHLLDLSEWVVDIDDDVTSYSFSGKGNISIEFDMIQLTALIVPASNWSGYEMVNFTAHLGEEMVYQTIMITVLPVNDPPWDLTIIVSDDHPMENRSFWLNGSAKDPDLIYGDELDFNWSSNISGHLGYSDSLEVFLPYGLHLITLNVTDKVGSWITRSIGINVTKIENNTEDPDDNGTGPDDNSTGPDDTTDDDDEMDDDDTQPADDDIGPDDDITDDDDKERDDDEGNGILLPMIIIVSVIVIALIILTFILVGRSREEVMDWEE